MTLTATFEGIQTDKNPQEAGFRIGTSSSSLTLQTVYSSNIPYNTANGSFSATVASLSPSTTYYYQAFMVVSDGNGGYTEIVSNTGTFTTLAQSAEPLPGWLELPAVTGSEDFVGEFYGSSSHTAANRNYSYNYSYSHYGCLWVAYPLAPGHLSGTQSGSWDKNPVIDESYQVMSVIGSSSYPSKYNAEGYSKGHQIPNADRKSNSTMNAQTYYLTNQTPQIGNKFNGSIWGSLETAVRNEVNDYQDTVYVVTGACYQTVDGNETVSQLTGANNSIVPYKVDVPNYYWKVLLKVKWAGSGSNKYIQSACAVGFWYEHKEYASGTSFYGSDYVKSVNEIEALTGFDFFTNLPGTETSGLEQSTETNKNWQTFLDF